MAQEHSLPTITHTTLNWTKTSLALRVFYKRKFTFTWNHSVKFESKTLLSNFTTLTIKGPKKWQCSNSLMNNATVLGIAKVHELAKISRSIEELSSLLDKACEKRLPTKRDKREQAKEEELARQASAAGIEVPRIRFIEEYDRKKWPHWHLLYSAQMGADMANIKAREGNATIIASIPLEEAKNNTVKQLIEKGYKIQLKEDVEGYEEDNILLGVV